jgi:cytochrome c oxidase subunit 2
MMGMRLGITLFLVMAIAGCTPYSIFDPAGEQAQWLATLGWWLVGLVSFIILVMGGLLLWGALRRRGSLDTHLPVDVDGGKRWILIGGVAIPVIVLSGLFVVTLVTLRVLPGNPEAAEINIHVTAHQWWWEADYLHESPSENFKTANEIHIPVGQPVRIKLTSADVIHSFWAPRLHGKLDAIPGHDNYIMLEANEPGVYRGECAEYCGVQHTNMRFVVVAQPPEEYRAWVARQRQPARPPAEPLLAKGMEAFETYACAMCHSIRGTKARGEVAPDLTHFGSRLHIAGVMPNTRARLQAWIVNAQAHKPGVHMPTLDQFDGPTLNALAAYLESLK